MGTPQAPQQSGVLPPSDVQEARGAQQMGRVQRPDPPGGTWIKARSGVMGPQDQMFEHARLHNHRFKAAFDYLPYGHDRVVKMFASYLSWQDFVRDTLLKEEPQNRHFYEVIPEGEPCKLYLDVEWIGPADPEKVLLHHLIDELIAYVKVRFCSQTAP